MGKIRQINIKNRTYHFYGDIINLKKFNSNLLKIDKKSCKNISTYNIGYITIKKNWWLWKYLQLKSFVFTCISGYIEEKNWNKYLIFDSTDENKELLTKYNVWGKIKNEIRTINGGTENDYEKDYMKINFNSDDDLPLNKTIKILQYDYNYQICFWRRW